jgi:hypothetical protein
MAQPLVVSSDAAYATKRNIMFPGTQAQATAAEARAQSRINDALTGTGATVTIAAGSVKVAT